MRPIMPNTRPAVAPAAIAWCDVHGEAHWHVTELQHVAGRYTCFLCDERGAIVRRDQWGDLHQFCSRHYQAMLEVEEI